MLSSIKNASERQNIIDGYNKTVESRIAQPDQSNVIIINHFEKILKNWLDIHTESTPITTPTGETIASPPRPSIDDRFAKQVSIPVIATIDKSKYDEWTALFTKAGYNVKIDQYRFTVTMP